MAKILPPEAVAFDDVKVDLVASIKDGREQGFNLAAIREKATRYADAVRTTITASWNASATPSAAGFDTEFPALERAYRDWKSVKLAFEETFRLAYNGAAPIKNLLIDQIYADLEEVVGDPLAESYTRLRAEWLKHLANRPWDAYKYGTPTHVDSERLDDALSALVRGDELDIDDSLNELTGSLRHAFIDFIEAHPKDIGDLEAGIWKRPEIVVANDFWRRGTRRRLIEVLKANGSKRFSGAFSTLESFYAPLSHNAAASPQSIVATIATIPPEHRGRFHRCLMLHPDYEMRRYAVNNSDLISIWKVLTAQSTPCATILSLLEKLVGSSQYTTTQRKIFFDTVYRRLLSVTTRSDVLYTRGVVRILTKLNFFLEDRYFAKLMTLLDYLTAKERMYKIDDFTMREYTDALKREKDRVGNVDTDVPDFEGIPLVILRKLARDGHHWDLLAMHPIVKIAKETIPHIGTPDRAYRVVKNQRVNQEVIRAIGKRRSLFSGLNAKLALLSNPRTPLGIALEYLPDLGKPDVEALLRRDGIHPELRAMLRNQFIRRNA